MNRRGSVVLSFLIGLTVMLLVGYTTDQIIQNVYDSTNTALRANVVAGGGSGSVGPGTVNTIAKFTPSTTTIGNSGITDDGSGAIGIYPASGTPQAVTITYASGVGADIAGAATTIKASGSTGAGLGGQIIFQNTNKAGSSSTANTYGNVLTLSPPNTGTTAPVNYLDIKNSIASGSHVDITATGSDINIPLQIFSKGAGALDLGTTTINPVLRVAGTTTVNINSQLTFCNGGINSACATFIAQDGGTGATLQLGIDSNTPITQTIKALDAVSGVNSGSDLVLKGGNKSTTGQDGAVVLGKGYAVANLPTGRPEGARAWVTDQVTACPAIGVAPTAGGAIRCPVFFDGTNWVGG